MCLDAFLTRFRKVLEGDRVDEDLLLAPGRCPRNLALDPGCRISALDLYRMMLGDAERGSKTLHAWRLIGPDIGQQPLALLRR